MAKLCNSGGGALPELAGFRIADIPYKPFWNVLEILLKKNIFKNYRNKVLIVNHAKHIIGADGSCEVCL